MDRAVRHLFAEARPLESGVRDTLALLGNAAEADFVYVWRGGADAAGQPRVSLIAGWTERAEADAAGRAPGGALVSAWMERLAAGKSVRGSVRELPETERDCLEPLGALSVIAAPVILRGQFWGCMGFIDCRRERAWSGEEENALRVAGALVGAAVAREESDRARVFSEKRFRDVVEAAGDIIWEVDNDWRFLFVSDRCTGALGRSPADLAGQRAFDALDEDGRPAEFVEKINASLAGQGFFRGVEHTVRDAEGRTRHLRSSGVRLVDAGGNATGIRAASADVTEDKEGAQVAMDALVDLMSANEELEQYSSLTQDLARQAEAASRVKSEFLANIGHEVRTPVNIITGMAYLALRTDLTPQQREYVTRVHEAGDALLAIMNNIIEFAKMEGGALALERYPLRFSDVVRAAVSGFESQAASKGLSLRVALDPSIPALLLGDPSRIGQIFRNLLSNALKFTDAGGIEVECLAEEVTDAETTLRCRVTDSGVGISPDQAEKLFVPFTQADGSSSRRFGGTGVGLALTRKLISAMQGEIWMESALGSGTSMLFTLTLPLAVPGTAAESAALEDATEEADGDPSPPSSEKLSWTSESASLRGNLGLTPQQRADVVRLRELLADDDGGALAMFGRLYPVLKRNNGSCAARMQAAFAVLDFPAAIAALDEGYTW